MPIKALAIFDFDGTMINGDSIIRYVAYAMAHGYESRLKIPARLFQGLLAVSGLISAERGKSLARSFLSRMEADKQEEFNRSFCRDILMPRVHRAAVQRMEQHRQQGLCILLVSASPETYINYLKEYLPVDTVIASPTNDNGEVSSSTRGQEKARRVKAWAQREGIDIDWPGSFSYGNSSNDLPIMRLTGHPVCVNPNRRMKKQAQNLKKEYWKK